MKLTKTCYVYRFIDIHGSTMYVGETNNINRRIGEHISFKSGKFNEENINNLHRVDYIKVENKMIARQFEIYYINKYKPHLNISDKYKSVIFREDEYYERSWKVYRVYNNMSKVKGKTLSKVEGTIIAIGVYAALFGLLFYTLF